MSRRSNKAFPHLVAKPHPRTAKHDAAQLRSRCSFTAEKPEFAPVPSFDMTQGIAARLAREIWNLIVSGGVDGIVVTHGTDTMFDG
ncbi:MAG: hypothetical protein C5B58_13095 [Acidobacteria bacterium]|nr:MAG: hypothetical protein C5B58_13095 [Acidobacteriota bacterium]